MDREDQWMTRLLEASLQSSGLSEREVEELLGWEPGTLGRMFDGTAECGPLQLLAVFAVLDAEKHRGPERPQRRERGTQMVQELIERFRGLGYRGPEAASAGLPPATGNLEKTVEEVLARTFGADSGKGRGRR